MGSEQFFIGKESNKEQDAVKLSSASKLLFTFTRSPAALLRFKSKASTLGKTTARARWSFAITAVIYDVQRRLWSWQWLKTRALERKAFINLHKRRALELNNLTPRETLTVEECGEITRLRQDLTPADARFYMSLLEYEIARLVKHKCVPCYLLDVLRINATFHRQSKL